MDPKYGYGEKGSFSFPTVPPSAHLTYKARSSAGRASRPGLLLAAGGGRCPLFRPGALIRCVLISPTQVELLGFEAADEERGPRGMMFEERLEAAERRRVDGNELFRTGQFEEAVAKYR